MSQADTINRVFRDYQRYTGDGLPGEPLAAPLPVGDPRSPQHNPTKKAVREAFAGLAETADELDGAVASAAASAAQSLVAAKAAGAPLVTSLTDPMPVDGKIEILQVSEGAQVWEVQSSAWALIGWIEGPEFPTVAAMAGGTGYVDGQRIAVTSGRNGQRQYFDYDAASIATADGALIVNATGMGAGRLIAVSSVYGGATISDIHASADATSSFVSLYAGSPAAVELNEFYPVSGNFARADIPHLGVGGLIIDGTDIPLNTTVGLADMTVYVDPAGSDSANHGLTAAHPFATLNRAEASLPKITFDHQQTVVMGTGVHNGSYTPAGDMPRAAILFPGQRLRRKRTAQSGSDLVGPVVYKGQGDTTIVETNPATGYPYAVYLTDAEAAFQDFKVRRAASGASQTLATIQRNAYGHFRKVNFAGSENGGIALGVIVESGGLAELIDCQMTGATNSDLTVYDDCLCSVAGVAASTKVGRVSNAGALSISGDVEFTVSFIASGGSVTRTVINGAKRPKFSAATCEFRAGSSAVLTNTDIETTMIIDGDVQMDACNIAGKIIADGGRVHLNACTTTGTSGDYPLVSRNGGEFIIDAASQIRNSSGNLVGVKYEGDKRRPAADGDTIPFVRTGPHTFTELEMQTATPEGWTLYLATTASGRYAGTPPAVGDLWTLIAEANYPYYTNIEIPRSASGTPYTIKVGERGGAYTALTVRWSGYGKWVPVSTGLVAA